MPLIENIPLKLNFKDCLRKIHVDEERAKKQKVNDTFKLFLSLTHPKALYIPAYITNRTGDTVEIDWVPFTSRILAQNLSKIERVFPYIISIGKALENETSKSDNLLKKVYLESFGDIALIYSKKYLKENLIQWYNLSKVSDMSPGRLDDWPITQQRQLFSLFGDVEEMIGVTLTDKFLMIPRKSISGIFFPSDISFESCKLCPRKNCYARKVPYDQGMRIQYGLA